MSYFDQLCHTRESEFQGRQIERNISQLNHLEENSTVKSSVDLEKRRRRMIKLKVNQIYNEKMKEES